MQWPYNSWFRRFIGARIRYSFVRTYWERDMAKLVTLEKLSVEEQDLVRRAGMVRTRWALGFAGLDALKRADTQDYYDVCRAYYIRTTKGRPFDMTMHNIVSHIDHRKTSLEIVED